MSKHTLTILAISTFLAFGILLSIGIGITAEDNTYDLESRVDDLESRIDAVEWKLR